MTSLPHPNTPDQLPIPTAEQEHLSGITAIYAKHEPGKNGTKFAYNAHTARGWQEEGHKVYVSQTEFVPLEPLVTPGNEQGLEALMVALLSEMEPGRLQNVLAQVNTPGGAVPSTTANSKQTRVDPNDPAKLAWEKEARKVLDRYYESGKKFCVEDLRRTVPLEFRNGFATRITREAAFTKRFETVTPSTDKSGGSCAWYQARWATEDRSKS